MPWASVLYSGGWIDRGWTFQEGYFLSRRRLFFTDHQALFDCDEGVTSEDLRLAQIKYHNMLEKWQSGLSETLVYDHITTYSDRCLTYESDILIAFNDIAADLEDQDPATRLYWGVPLVPNSCGYIDGFLLGLCWWQYFQTDKPSRRAGFPSWSWAGWPNDFGISYPLHSEQDTEINPASGLAIQVERNDGSKEEWKTFEENPDFSTSRQLYSRRVHVSAPSLQVRVRKQSAARCGSSPK